MNSEEVETQQLMIAYNAVMIHEDSRIVRWWINLCGLALTIICLGIGWWKYAAGSVVVALALNVIIVFWFTRLATARTGMPRAVQMVYHHAYRNDPAFSKLIASIYERHLDIVANEIESGGKRP